LGAAVKAVEKKIIEHFDGLHNLQQIELFNLLPLIVFLLQHPMTRTKAGLPTTGG